MNAYTTACAELAAEMTQERILADAAACLATLVALEDAAISQALDALNRLQTRALDDLREQLAQQALEAALTVRSAWLARLP